MKRRILASTVDLTPSGLGDLSIEQLEDGALQLVRRDQERREIAALRVLRAELSGLADIASLAIIELRTPPVSARAPGPSRFDPDGRAA
jgi:hypothetical protein